MRRSGRTSTVRSKAKHRSAVSWLSGRPLTPMKLMRSIAPQTSLRRKVHIRARHNTIHISFQANKSLLERRRPEGRKAAKSRRLQDQNAASSSGELVSVAKSMAASLKLNSSLAERETKMRERRMQLEVRH